MKTTEQPNRLRQPPDNVFYMECSLPSGMTISEYRRSRPRRPSRWARLKLLAGAAAQPA